MLQRILKHCQSQANSAKGPSSSRSKLKVESLEPRIALTVAGTASVTGEILRICGTSAGETIVIAELRDDFYVSADFLSTPMFFPKDQISTVIVEGEGGNDTLVATSMDSPLFLRGGAGDDRIFGGNSGDLIEGGLGDDLIYGNNGPDSIFGGEGMDRVFAGLGDDTVHGGLGDDTLVGMGGDDTINGNAGDDNVSGSAGADILAGNAGDDRVLGGAGNDTAYGGTGDDVLVGDGDDDTMFGDDGEDTLLGAGGNDTLNGGNDNDRVVGGNGDDVLSGGAGLDLLFGDDGGDELQGGEDADSLFGGRGPDTLFGNNGNDGLRGGAGDDVLAGQNGLDDLKGGDGKDILIGGELSDVLDGEGNEDFLVAGTTSHQNDADALGESRDLWLSADHFQVRVADLLAEFTAHNPAADGDQLMGGTGSDVFYTESSSTVFDRQTTEPVIGESFVAVSDLYFVDIGETFTATAANGVLANDMSFTGTLESTGVTLGAAHGSIAPATVNNGLDGIFEFTMDEHGRDYIIYEASDGSGQTWLARASFKVPDLPELPAGASLTATGTGLQVYDFEVGPGTSTPLPESIVTVDYVGYLPNGQIFDEGRLTNFALDSLIVGFSEGVQGMSKEGRRRIVIPPDLGYGENGNTGAGIAGTDTIIFDVDLISFATLP